MIHQLLLRLAWLSVGSLIKTYKYEFINLEYREKARALNPSRSFLFAVWHGQVLAAMSSHAWTEPYLVLASRSKDGDFAAYIGQKMNYVPVRGSSKKRNKDKGGKEAMNEYITKLKAGTSGGITIDGPKGPNQDSKVGVILIAQQSGAAILPTVTIPKSYWQFNSWDKFKIPKPFSTSKIIYGEPIAVPLNATPEQIEGYRIQLTECMKKLEANFT
jgi:lysophospholipid acyltransferase (LPLAT)-like uncharacterized protein